MQGEKIQKQEKLEKTNHRETTKESGNYSNSKLKLSQIEQEIEFLRKEIQRAEDQMQSSREQIKGNYFVNKALIDESEKMNEGVPKKKKNKDIISNIHHLTEFLQKKYLPDQEKLEPETTHPKNHDIQKIMTKYTTNQTNQRSQKKTQSSRSKSKDRHLSSNQKIKSQIQKLLKKDLTKEDLQNDYCISPPKKVICRKFKSSKEYISKGISQFQQQTGRSKPKSKYQQHPTLYANTMPTQSNNNNQYINNQQNIQNRYRQYPIPQQQRSFVQYSQSRYTPHNQHFFQAFNQFPPKQMHPYYQQQSMIPRAFRNIDQQRFNNNSKQQFTRQRGRQNPLKIKLPVNYRKKNFQMQQMEQDQAISIARKYSQEDKDLINSIENNNDQNTIITKQKKKNSQQAQNSLFYQRSRQKIIGTPKLQQKLYRKTGGSLSPEIKPVKTDGKKHPKIIVPQTKTPKRLKEVNQIPYKYLSQTPQHRINSEDVNNMLHINPETNQKGFFGIPISPFNTGENGTPHEDKKYYMQKLKKYVYDKNTPDDSLKIVFKKHFIQQWQQLKFAKDKHQISQKDLEKKSITLAPIDRKIKKKTFVFDMDETLVHCNTDQNKPCDKEIIMNFGKNDLKARISFRPNIILCLKKLKQHAELILFTASHESYADVLLDEIDPKGEIFDYRFYRKNCVTQDQRLFIKDLRIFSNRSLKDMVLIDNAAYSYAHQIENGCPIIPYYHDKQDTEIEELTEFLLGMLDLEDVRPYLNQYFEMPKIMTFLDPYVAINQLFFK